MKLMDRSVPVRTEFEMRANAMGGTDFTGYASLFDSDSEPMPFIETVAPGAFSRSLALPTVHTFVLNHDDARVFASTRTGRLQLREDGRGLLTKASLPDTQDAADLRALNAVGEVWGMSFTFRAARDRGDEWPVPGMRRRLLNVELGHVTVLTGMQPAYPGTMGTTQIRALAKELSSTMDDLENLIDGLREGRDLSPDERDLLGRLSLRFNPEPDPEPVPDDVPAPAVGRSLEEQKAKFLLSGIEV